MAIALEELSPEAQSAVAAAAAGHGKKLSDPVKRELTKRAQSHAGGSERVRVAHSYRIDGSGALRAAQAVSTRGGRQNVLAKLILATILGLVALEVASLASGRFFNWDCGKGTTPPTPQPAQPSNFAAQFKQNLAAGG